MASDNDSYNPPVIITLMRMPDQRCVEIFTEMETQFLISHPGWRRTSSTETGGNTVLHVAAIMGKVETLKWIMSRPLGVDLIKTRNIEGEDPVQALVALMEHNRTVAHCTHADISHQFRGFEDSHVQCLVVLKGIENPRAEELARLKGGCTCGHCIEGIISPRMGRSLLREIEICLLLWRDIPETGDDVWPDTLATRREEVRESYRIVRDAHSILLSALAGCLKQGKLPSDSEIRKLDFRPGYDASFEEAFETRVVLSDLARMVFNSAFLHDTTGTNFLLGRLMHQSIFGNLPKCRNDGEYPSALVRCGYHCEF